MSTIQGCGTKFLGFSSRDEKGCNFATKWFVLFYWPIIPLKRYYLEIGGSNSSSAGVTFTTSRSYTIFKTTRVHFLEVLMTYLYIYIVLPVCAVCPNAFISQWVKQQILPDWFSIVAVLSSIVVPGSVILLNRMRINGKLSVKRVTKEN